MVYINFFRCIAAMLLLLAALDCTAQIDANRLRDSSLIQSKDSLYIKVSTQFTVDKDGNISDVAVTKVDCAECDFIEIETYKYRAIDLVKTMKLKPAVNNGKSVKVQYNQPITFVVAKQRE